ncbi:hypothetical protein R1CP_32530 [Rhodococcus opacus]|uniref:Uncharacterized protein n=1 Tax=Rhodococcus opacus TaxID=37919 RepID=A0A1B1KF00_RHOOP|nr:hypothetical protein [Rhodococcus opacus]ANS31129.1 hypothetical protein R1CP_32530 [Rhodococcus opacus]
MDPIVPRRITENDTELVHGLPRPANLPVSENLWTMLRDGTLDSATRESRLLAAAIRLEQVVERLRLQERIADVASSRGIVIRWVEEGAGLRCRFEVSGEIARYGLTLEEAQFSLGIDAPSSR